MNYQLFGVTYYDGNYLLGPGEPKMAPVGATMIWPVVANLNSLDLQI